jgi:hypothetical protein
VEILTTLMVGGAVCIPSEENRLNNLKNSMAVMKVNWAVLTPSFVGFIDPTDVSQDLQVKICTLNYSSKL